MIESVHIQNFQSHKDTKICFTEGVNVLIGASDAGKSAIFRAIQWCLYNRPLGDGFRSYWGGDTSVTLRFFDGRELTRIKGKGVNSYFIDGIELKAFGTQPPDEVLALHNLDQTLNVQAQIDPIFLLQSSPGEVAKHFNEIADLEKIDITSKNLDTEARALKKQREVQAESLIQAETMLEDANARLEIVEPLAASLVILSNKKKEIEESQAVIQKTLEDITKTTERKESLQKKVIPFGLMTQVQDLLADKQEATKDRDTLLVLLQSIFTLKDNLSKVKRKLAPEDILKRFEGLLNEVVEIGHSIKSLQTIIKRSKDCNDGLTKKSKGLIPDALIDAIQDRLKRQEIIGNRIEAMDRVLDALFHINQEITTSTVTLSEISHEITEHTKGECPLCGRKD